MKGHIPAYPGPSDHCAYCGQLCIVGETCTARASEGTPMHTKPMDDNEGTFDKPKPCKEPCRRCGAPKVTYQQWDSNCGGYEDHKFTCGACGFWWWVDGIDS